jgi:hypothetical protein
MTEIIMATGYKLDTFEAERSVDGWIFGNWKGGGKSVDVNTKKF